MLSAVRPRGTLLSSSRRLFSTSMASRSSLRIGYVPEHFSTPIYFAKKHYGLDADLKPFPSGTGHMITSLRSGEIDVGIGLTEGWVAGLGKESLEGDGGYRLVGTYVESPLRWAISTGAKRPEIQSVQDLAGSKIGVSRIGSGSYVMGYVLADEQGWLTKKSRASPESPAPSPFSDFVVLNTFEKLRGAVNSGEADFFMWEYFTSKRYYDNGQIRHVGDIYTPWSSWKIVASTNLMGGGSFDPKLTELFGKLDQGIAYFNEHHDEAVSYISTELDYSEDDAREWLKTVQFPKHTAGVDAAVVDNTVGVLRKAGVLAANKGMEPRQMIALKR